MKKIRENQYLTGLLIQQTKEDIPVKVDRYLFSAMMHNYFEALFAEKPEVQQAWTQETPENSKARIIRDATEYFLLDMLLDSFSYKKRDYPGFEKKERQEISDHFKKNLFWETFTRPMEERPVFAKEKRIEGVIQYAVSDQTGRLKALYHDFRPYFPSAFTISKTPDGWLILSAHGLQFKFRVNYEGCRICLPDGFARYYLGFPKKSGIRVNVEIAFEDEGTDCGETCRTFYRQMALFLRFFKECFSFEYFLKKYDWENLLIQSEIMERLLTEKLAVK